jgi:hypothetical protein
MIRLGQVIAVFGTLMALAASGYNLKWMERQMRNLAIESYKTGYISISDFNRKLEEPIHKKGH